jgi:hypothetical protein
MACRRHSGTRTPDQRSIADVGAQPEKKTIVKWGLKNDTMWVVFEAWSNALRSRDHLLRAAGKHESVLGFSDVAAGAASDDVRPECRNRRAKATASCLLVPTAAAMNATNGRRGRGCVLGAERAYRERRRLRPS